MTTLDYILIYCYGVFAAVLLRFLWHFKILRDTLKSNMKSEIKFEILVRVLLKGQIFLSWLYVGWKIFDLLAEAYYKLLDEIEKLERNN